MTRVTKGLYLYKNSDPKWLSAPAPLYACTVYSSDKLYWEADFQPLAIFINMIHKN